jgi:membrane-bound lytic murein transglycosylase F
MLPVDLRRVMTEKKRLFTSLLWLMLLGLTLTLLVAYSVRKNEIRRSTDRSLRIAYLPTEMAESRLSPYGPGFERELVTLFCTRFSLPARWIAIDSPQTGWRLLGSGEADILLGAGAWLKPAPGTEHIEAGPLYNTGAPLVLQDKKTAGAGRISLPCSDSVILPAGSFLEELRTEMAIDSGCTPLIRPAITTSLPPLLSDLEGTPSSALVGSPLASLWLPFFPKIRAGTPDQDLTYGSRWYWSTRDTSKTTKLRRFWQKMHDSDILRELEDKYLGFFPEEIDYYELWHFSRTLRRKLPLYATTIRSEARRLDLDPLLLIAMIYQESHFQHNAESKTGVRGLLQLTRATAGEMGIENRLDPHASIRGGARYLKKLLGQVQTRGPRAWDNIFLALASYNQGFGHTLDAMRLAEEQGLNGLAWRDVKTVFPLLAYRKYYSKARYGYCRGYEAVDYVESIRYYYYLLHGFIALSRPEMKYLAPVLLAENAPS